MGLQLGVQRGRDARSLPLRSVDHFREDSEVGEDLLVDYDDTGRTERVTYSAPNQKSYGNAAYNRRVEYAYDPTHGGVSEISTSDGVALQMAYLRPGGAAPGNARSIAGNHGWELFPW